MELTDAVLMNLGTFVRLQTFDALIQPMTCLPKHQQQAAEHSVGNSATDYNNTCTCVLLDLPAAGDGAGEPARRDAS